MLSLEFFSEPQVFFSQKKEKKVLFILNFEIFNHSSISHFTSTHFLKLLFELLIISSRSQSLQGFTILIMTSVITNLKVNLSPTYQPESCDPDHRVEFMTKDPEKNQPDLAFNRSDSLKFDFESQKEDQDQMEPLIELDQRMITELNGMSSLSILEPPHSTSERKSEFNPWTFPTRTQPARGLTWAPYHHHHLLLPSTSSCSLEVSRIEDYHSQTSILQSLTHEDELQSTQDQRSLDLTPIPRPSSPPLKHTSCLKVDLNILMKIQLNGLRNSKPLLQSRSTSKRKYRESLEPIQEEEPSNENENRSQLFKKLKTNSKCPSISHSIIP